MLINATSQLKSLLAVAAIWALSAALAPQASAQDSSLLRRQPVRPAGISLSLENSSLLYKKPEPPPTLRLHDTLTVIVSIKTRVMSEGEVQNKKKLSLDAVLQDWIRFDKGPSVKPARQAEGDPRIKGKYDSQYRSEAELETRDSLTFNIAAEVVDIRPNGNLVIEAHRSVTNNEEVWDLSLSGVINRKDVDPNNTILSDKIAELRIDKRERGHVRDGYRRGWFQKFFDKYQPF